MTSSDENRVSASGSRVTMGWPVLLWVVWVVFPSLVVAPASGRSGALAQIIAGQVGSSAVPYLQSAPRPLLVYLLASHLLALPALLLLARSLRSSPFWRNAAAQLSAALFRCLALWLSLYLAGAAVVALVMLLRGADSALTSSWAVRLAWYGLISTLPQAGWAMGLALIIRRARLWVVAAISGAMVMAISSSALLTQQVLFPTPLRLREQLLSGRADASFSSMLGLVAWGVLLAGSGLAIRTVGRTRGTALLAGEIDV